MHSQLDSYIKQYGGKAGVLQLLHDYYPNLRQYLAPAWIVSHGSKVTKEVYKALIDSRKSFGSPDILVRSSHHKDRFGLVDFLPTITMLDSRRERSNEPEEFQDVLDHRIQNAFGGHNEKYAKELHYLLVPRIEHTLYTITEHPNYIDHLFVDTGEVGNYYARSTSDVVGDNIIGLEGYPDTSAIKKTVSLTQVLRALKIFKEEDKLQYEIAIAKSGMPYIFQVRKFSDAFTALPKEVFANDKMIFKSRIMGNLPDDKPLYHYHGANLNELELAIDISCGDELLFSCDQCSGYTTLEQSPSNLKGFISESHLALFHNLTAPSQAVLQNGGFVSLKTKAPIHDGYVRAQIDQQGIKQLETNLKY